MMRGEALRQYGGVTGIVLVTLYLLLHEPVWDISLPDLGAFEVDGCPIPPSSRSSSSRAAHTGAGCTGAGWCGSGIVISVSGRRPYDMALVLANIENIRNRWKETTPIELWFKGQGEAYPAYFKKRMCQLGGVRLRDLSRRSHCVKYYCKMAAMEFSDFDRVLLLDSNALLFQPPSAFFAKLEGAAASPIYLFRDYQACFASLGRGYTEHGLGVNPDYFCALSHGQEIDSSAVLFDRSRAAASLADTIEMRHRWLVGFLTLGDKDTWLLSAIRTGTAATVHEVGPSFFVFDGMPLEGHLHLDAGKPLYGNIQMLSACTMGTVGLSFLRVKPNTATVSAVAPMCEAKLKPSVSSQMISAGAMLQDMLKAACRVVQDYNAATATTSTAGDARECKFTCGDRVLDPGIYGC